ncbi:MAG: non-homologous end-joining DNA ligase [Thermoanaerobacteraceae bacterium]|nr:non-homologous end-joining DNA ligase [Thermoanaerobacteraceae bacterium]
MNEMELTNLDKVFWPQEGLTKFALIKHYIDLAPVVLPYLKGRPVIMKRYPDGIKGQAFYQRECPAGAPPWVETVTVHHRESGKRVNYVLCNNPETLAWLANLGCIELHAWLSRAEHLEYPDIAVIDLDPAEGATFRDVLEVAVLLRGVLKELGLTGYPKTSGARGLHVFIPLAPRWTFSEVTAAVGALAGMMAEIYPAKVTIAHAIARRRGKVYFDYRQNARGRSMAFPYSLRPLPGAPVSAPLTWEEVEEGRIVPQDFNIHTICSRLQERGDLYRGLLEVRNDLTSLLEAARVLVSP